MKIVQQRPPLVVLAGDVGTGKTELAETVGDAVARQEDIEDNSVPIKPFDKRPGACWRNDTVAFCGVRSYLFRGEQAA